MAPQLYLASQSPRRRELLGQIGIRYESLAVVVDEALRPGESAPAYVTRLALAKARAGWQSLGERPPRPVLGADTAVVVDGAIFGKPRDRDEGLAMLARLSGRRHRVASAVALVNDGREGVRLQQSEVCLRALSPGECRAYWASGEPADKAGGYAIQGRAAAFVAELRGSYSGVVGLPLFETAELLAEFGIHLLRDPAAEDR